MSICDTCHSPGSCCKRITISRATGQELTFWMDEPLEEQITAQMPEPFNGFTPLEVKEEWIDPLTLRPVGYVFWQCDNLLPNGRCSVYENRPELCRNYQPKSDKLCVYYEGPGE